MKSKTRRDGWNGKLFRRLREARGRTREWVATRTGKTADMIERYERDEVFPYHAWRDAAALALQLNRRDLGIEGD